MKYVIMMLSVFCVLFLVAPSHGATTFKLYDDFSGSAIDHTKWSGWESDNNEGLAREAVRQINTNVGALQMSIHSYGLITSEKDAPTNSGERLAMMDGSKVTAMKGVISVEDYSWNANVEDMVRIEAVIGGMFFNMGTPTSGSSKDDVEAQIGLYFESNAFEVYGIVRECLDATCSNWSQIGKTNSLGAYSVAQKVTVSVQWDKTNRRFIFQNLTNKKSQNVSYSAKVISSPGTPAAGNKRLSVNVTVPSYSTSPCSEAFIEVAFGPVYINSN
jgi:hypothetical protein